MKKLIRTFLLLTFLGGGNLYASSALQNSLEGKSHYLTFKIQEQIQAFDFEDDYQNIQDVFTSSVKSSKLCAYNIHDDLQNKLGYPTEKVKSLFYFLRSKNEIDDMGLSFFLRQIKLHGQLKHSSRQVKLEAKYRLVFDKFIATGTGSIKCISEDIPKMLRRILEKLDIQKAKKIKVHLKRYLAEKPDLVQVIRPLILLTENQKVSWKLNLREYIALKSEVRRQVPMDVYESMQTQKRSEYATEYLKKEKRTRRQRLYQDYSFIQIILLKDIISELKRDLGAVRMEYVLYDSLGGVIDSYSMEPMEQFCLTIKLMRKKISILNENYFFKNRTSNFEDSMMAAVELGVISTHEFDSVFAFKEIWDPNKTFWDKNQIWIKTFGALAGVVLPPPYGAIPMLVIMGIETVSQLKNGQSGSVNHNLCRMQ